MRVHRFLTGVLLAGSLPVFIAIGCSDSSSPQKSASEAPEQTNQPARANSTGCTVEQQGDERVVTFSATASWNSGFSVKHVLRQRDLGDGNTDVTSDLTLSTGAHDVARTLITRKHDGSLDVTMQYAPPATGIQQATMTSADGVTGVMNVDGRVTLPFELVEQPTVVFADGAPPPELKLNNNIRDSFDRLITETQAAASACRANALNPSAASLTAEGSAAATVDRGHPSNTFITAKCLGCIGACDAGYTDCLYHGIPAVVGFCGPFIPLCVVGGIVVCSAALVVCTHVCKTSSATCCPVGCKPTLFNEACCASGETCLNSDTGLCCSPGKRTCNGVACCGGTETCCGSSCCGQNETCFDASNGRCCDVNQVCGNKCCLSTSVCVDRATSTCCAPDLGESPCGNKCCGIGQACVSGSCCPQAKECFGVCCGATEVCDRGTLSCRPSFCPPDQLECGTSCCAPFTGCNPNTNACCPTEQIFCTKFNICTPPQQCVQ